MTHVMNPGKAQAFEQLVQEHERMVYLLCLRMMGNREDALDCAQEAMLNAYQAFDRYRGEANVKTWLYRIAHNTCIDALRRRKQVLSLDTLRDGGFDVADTKAQTPHAVLESKERYEEINRAVQKLPEDQRAVLVMRDYQNMAYDEIARVLDLPEGTVKSRINRAREKIKKILLKNGEQNACSSVQDK